MAQIEFGVQYNGASMAATIGPIEFAEWTERLGFRSYFAPDLLTLPTLDPFALLAAVAVRTERMRLGTGVAVVPFRSPYQLAKVATSVDALSGGRMVLGVGSGQMIGGDFDIEGARPEERGAITDERLALVRRLLAEPSVTHGGPRYPMRDVALLPRPVQSPLPIWTGAMWSEGGFARAPLERTARLADGFHPNGMTPAGYAEGRRIIEETAAGAGRDPAAFTWSCNMYVCMGESRGAAYRELLAAMARRFGNDAWEVDPASVLIGNAEECAEAVEAFADAGVRHFTVNALCAPESLLATYERFAAEVVLRYAGPPAP